MYYVAYKDSGTWPNHYVYIRISYFYICVSLNGGTLKTPQNDHF